MTDKPLSATPRTDGVVAQTMRSYSKSQTLRTGVWVDTDFARQLEREIIALTADLSAGRLAVVEECAKVCDKRVDGWGNVPVPSTENGRKQEAKLLGTAIRALKRTGGEGATSPAAESAKRES